MEVRHRKKFSFPLGDPIFPVFSLALRAVPVPATVVADAGIPTIRAGTYMSTEVYSPAAFQRR